MWCTSAWGELGVATGVVLDKGSGGGKVLKIQAEFSKGPREEGGPQGRGRKLVTNTTLLLFLFTAQE